MKINQYLSLGRCIGMVVAFITMPASAATGQGISEKEYKLDSLETLVDSLMPKVDTQDAKELFRVYFATIDRAVKPKEWADRMKADVMSNMFDQYSTDDQGEIYSLYQENSLHAADSLRSRVKCHYDAMIKKYGHLFPGRPAPNLTFTDTDGKALSLQSFKGQLLLVDIWGTWCAPCIEEMPYLAKLQDEYAARKDVRIMSIACDKKAERWKAYLAKHPTSWHQYLVTDAGNKMLDEVYFCEGIPRFIIIGRDGNIISADAFRPSEKSFSEYFRKIVNQ